MRASDDEQGINKLRPYDYVLTSFYLVDRGCYCYFGFILWKYDLNNYQCDLIANAEDGVSLIFVLQNTMAAMGHDGPSLPFDFKFPFQNKSILIKSNLINKTR